MKNIVVIGGGTAGWMTAAGLASMMEGLNLNITLIESEAIATVGVGEATLPHIKFFNEAIGIDEAEFMRATSATFKLGIEFVDWGRKGQSYIHPFGEFGLANAAIPFHHYWRKLSDDPRVGSLQDYSLPIIACRYNKFDRPSDDPKSVKSTYRYAYQFDSLKYAPFLRRHGEARGVKRIEGRVVDVDLSPETGDILSVLLEDGSVIEGDLFIDCTGFYGLLIEKSLETGYDKWTEWLPVDRAVAVPCEHIGPLRPYTRATADEAGWRWRIPLQNRTGNGYVYASDFISDDAAEERLLKCLEGEPMSAPRRLRFTTGKRKKLWHKNCVSIGLSGGFLEPLESTSIYLIQEGITKLLELFPDGNDLDVSRREYNRLMDLEFERIRDFLILHYHATKRDDTPFWDYVRTMKIPDSLAEKMELFHQSGRVVKYDFGLFLEPSWIAVYMGQDYHPVSYDPRVDLLSEADIAQHLLGLKHLMHNTVSAMPSHETFIDDHVLG
ncbi:MAG: tryptophan halogenase family protein [Maricaulaceae bacterium]